MEQGVLLYIEGTSIVPVLAVALHSLRRYFSGNVHIIIGPGVPEWFVAASATTRADSDYSITYTYDLVGNRTKKEIDSDGDGNTNETITYDYNSNDQLTSEVSTVNGTTGYTYDDNGFMTEKDPNGVYLYEFEADLQGRLKTAKVHFGTHDDVHTDYTYNDQGIRTRAEQTLYKIAGSRPCIWCCFQLYTH